MLEDVGAWVSRREAAIGAAAVLETRNGDLAREEAAAEHARRAVLGQLLAAGVQAREGESLGALCATAGEHIKESDAAVERRKTLRQQLTQGERALQDLEDELKCADEAYGQWEQEWSSALTAAKVSTPSHTVAEAEAAIDQVAKVADALDKVDTIRRDRIDSMALDLERFESQGRSLAAKLGADTASQEDVAGLSKALGERLQQALSARQSWVAAEQALNTTNQQRDDANLEVQTARARVKPLLDAAGVSTIAEALPLFERSDKKRHLSVDIVDARDALMKGGDGLALEAVTAEVDACDIAMLPSELDETGRALLASTEGLTTLTEERVRKQQALAAIAGQANANAAIAEAKRQEALAAMADASERYLKVATASKLLRWAIDRYRDRKQGPMLSRAGVIFSGLTLGRFKKLLVDYDKEPLTLAAQRHTGEVVEVSGMSEGTRDQLYLALRLAALELHIEQAEALPFVADDLFINFDDERAKAGLAALRELSKQTQVIFLSHHDHLVPVVREVFGSSVNIVALSA